MVRSGVWKSVGVITGLTLMVIAGTTTRSMRVRAQNGNDDESKIQRGYEIAPVPLNLAGKNRALVGLGSYIVNAVGDCNGCHSAGPQTEFAAGGNPYMKAPFYSGTKKIDATKYLGGGRDFGPYVSLQHLYSRNLTPDKTGMPAGGMNFAQFEDVLRHGTDYDHIHPSCTAPGVPANCLAAPFNGELLQVMRWPFFQNMTEHEIEAIYEYLSAIPCNPGPNIEGAPYLQNQCE